MNKLNKENFTLFIDENLPKLRNFINSQFKLSYHDLNDIMQNSVLKAWKSRGECNDNIYSWFCSICKNEACNFLNKRATISTFEIYGENLEELDAFLEETGATFLQKKEDMQEYKEMISKILCCLTQNHRDILKYVVLQEKSYIETSQLLDIPIGSIMSGFYGAKKQAAKIIGKLNEYQLINL